MEVYYKSSLDVFSLYGSIAYDFVIVLDPKINMIKFNIRYFEKIDVLLHYTHGVYMIIIISASNN